MSRSSCCRAREPTRCSRRRTRARSGRFGLMKWTVMLAALAVAACDRGAEPPGAKPASAPVATPANATAQLQELAKSNATVLGYLYSAETPYIVASLDGGTLVWRTQGGANSVAQGRVAPLNES